MTNCSGHRASHYVCLTWSAQTPTCKQWTVLKGRPELPTEIKLVLQLKAQTAPRFTDSWPTPNAHWLPYVNLADGLHRISPSQTPSNTWLGCVYKTLRVRAWVSSIMRQHCWRLKPCTGAGIEASLLHSLAAMESWHLRKSADEPWAVLRASISVCFFRLSHLKPHEKEKNNNNNQHLFISEGTVMDIITNPLQSFL